MNLEQRIHDTALENYSRKNDRTTRRPANGFDDLGIAPSLMKGIDRLNFDNPTPIQKDSIPAGIQGDDIIAIAKTGSGKTLAYGIPMLQRLSKSNRGTGLVVVPTRELAIQVEEALQTFSRPLNIRMAVLIGGASMTLQRNVLKNKPRIIVATPGRLMDHIERRTLSLANLEVFILDEADRMLDMGFLPDIKKIIKSIPDKRQTMLFSATMPKEIEAIAEKLMANPTRIEVDRSGTTPAEVSHEMFIINNHDKGRLLAVQLKQCSGPVLVFTRTKWMARKLTTKVNSLGFATAEIHSNRTLEQRRKALEGFKRGRYQILIATDIAARGIDVSNIELVVNYDMPANSEDYVHRIGRTGRAGKTGHAVSFATIGQERSIRDLERFMKIKLTISTLPTLPSERVLLNEADQLCRKNEPSRAEKPPKRKFQKDRPSKYRDDKKGDSRKPGMKRTESKKRDFTRKDSKDRPSKYRDDKKGDSRKSSVKRTESKKRDFTKKDSKPKKSQAADSGQSDSNNKKSFWSNFIMRRPTKKKSVGQGARRKRRAKHK